MPRKSKFPFFRIEDIPSPEQVELWASRQDWEKVILAANAKNYSRPALLKADSTLMMAARLLEQHQSPESLQALISQFDRGTSGVWHEALRAIGKQRQPAALEFLKQFQAGTIADRELRDEGVSSLTRHFAGERFELPPIPVPSRVAENPALHNKLKMLLDQLNRLPDRPSSYAVIANFYGSAAQNPESYKYDKGILQVAEQWFLAGLQRWPNDVDLLRGIAGNSEGQEDWNKAAAYYEALLKIQPSNWTVHYRLHYLYWWHLKQYEKCLSLIESLVQWELKGISTRFLGKYSTAFVAANQVDRGIAFFQRLLVNLPEVFSIHYGLGELLAKAGRHEEAAAALEKSIDLEPGEDNQEARESLARLALKTNNRALAKKHVLTLRAMRKQIQQKEVEAADDNLTTEQ